MAVTTTQQKIAKILLTILIWFFGIVMVIPFIWMLSTSFKGMNEVFTYPIEWIPRNPSLAAYQTLFKKVPYFTYLWNSVKVSVIACIGTFFSCTMAGFAYAKVKFA